MYGSGLARRSVSTGKLPLPTTFQQDVRVGRTRASSALFLKQRPDQSRIPNEATATQQLPIVLSVNNALTLPLMLNIVPAAPGVLSALDGPTPPSVQNGAHIIAQHSADYSLVTSASPAKPGEYLIMYLVGMGATNPSVASGAATPAPRRFTVQPLHRSSPWAPSLPPCPLLDSHPTSSACIRSISRCQPAASSGELVVTSRKTASPRIRRCFRFQNKPAASQ